MGKEQSRGEATRAGTDNDDFLRVIVRHDFYQWHSAYKAAFYTISFVGFRFPSQNVELVLASVVLESLE